MIRTALALFALSLPAAALEEQTPLTGSDFAERVIGKTIYFYQYGRSYGAETYRADRTVTWRFTDDICSEGLWYAEEDAICFVYEHAPTEAQCWYFFDTPEGVLGRVVGADPADDLLGRSESPAPLICDQPYLGA